MSASSPFEVLVRRQPGYELMLTVRFTVQQHEGVVSLARTGWRDPRASRVGELTDVAPAELRGGRFTLVHSGSRKREGYSLARLTEDKLARIPDDRWTPLSAVTEMGFRYLTIPGASLAATPAAAAIRAQGPAGAEVAAPPGRAVARSTATGPRATAPRATGGTRTGSLLDRARHGGVRSAQQEAAASVSLGVPVTDMQAVPEELVDPTTAGTRVRINANGDFEIDGKTAAAPATAKAAVVAAPAAAAARPAAPRPAARPAARPTPRPGELGMLSADALRGRLEDAIERMAELEEQLRESHQRERDLLEVLQKWQDRRIQ